MKIVPIGKLTDRDEYMIVVTREQLVDLYGCVQWACRLLDYTSAPIDNAQRQQMLAFFKELPHTRNRKSLELALNGEYERVVGSEKVDHVPGFAG